MSATITAAPLPALPLPPPSCSSNPTVDDVARDLKRSPFFMTSADDINAALDSDAPNTDLEAIRALMHEGSRWEVAEGFRTSGNELAQAGGWMDAREFYDKAVTALEGKEMKSEKESRDRHRNCGENGEEDRPEGGAEVGKGMEIERPRSEKAGAREGGTREGGKEIYDQEEKEIETNDEAEKESLCLLRCLINRALCNLELQNYRRVITDCSHALTLPALIKVPSASTSLVAKAHYRLALAYLQLSSLDRADEHTSLGAHISPKDTAFPALQSRITTARQSLARAASARQSLLAEHKRSNQVLDNALVARRISISWTGIPSSASGGYSRTTPARLTSAKESVHWNADGGVHLEDTHLIVPVVLLYPRAHRSDVIARVAEGQTLVDVLEQVLPLPWDLSGEYVAGGVKAFVERYDGGGEERGKSEEEKQKEAVEERRKKVLMRWGGKIEMGRVLKGGEIADGALRVFVLPKSEAEAWIVEWKKERGK